MLLSKEEYTELYGEIPDPVFLLISVQSEQYLRSATTGVDGYNKLQNLSADSPAFTIVKLCAMEVARFLHLVQNVAIDGKIVTSISSGNESVSYSATEVEKAATDQSAKAKACISIVRNWLSSVQDDNGVNLLYMGAYPV